MTPRSYPTPAAFKQALETRLRTASSTGLDFGRRRQLLVFDRFLARLTSTVGDAATLKGGLALELRHATSATPTFHQDSLVGTMGTLEACPTGTCGIDTHVRLRAAGSALWRMSMNGAQIIVNVRERNASRVAVADDAVSTDSTPMNSGADSNGPILTRQGIPLAFDVGTNEAGAAEMRFIYLAQENGQLSLQGGWCDAGLQNCTRPSQWRIVGGSASATTLNFPTIKYAQLPSGAVDWKVAFVGEQNDQVAVFATDFQKDGSGNALPLNLSQVTNFQSPCPDTRAGTGIANLGGYWGDYDDMQYDAARGAFVRGFTDSSAGSR